MKIDLPRLFFRWFLKNKKPSKKKINIDKIENILVMSNTAIGDTLFATPALNLIKSKYPDKEVLAVLNPANYKLFETNPNIDKIVLYRGKWRDFLSVLFRLKHFDIDLTLILHSNEPQATPMAYLAGSDYIVKIPNDGNEFRHLHYNEKTARVLGEYTIQTQLKQLAYIGINETNFHMELFPNKDWYLDINRFVDQKITYVGFQLGATTKNRMWFEENWYKLASLILSYRGDVKIILTGSPKEVLLTNSLEKLINNKRVLNLAGKFDICGAAAVIERLSVLVTPDTGPLHIAAALKTPTVAFSVTGKESSSKPRDKTVKHQYIQKPVICDPCLDKRCQYQKCMWQITPEEVFNHVKSIVK